MAVQMIFLQTENKLDTTEGKAKQVDIDNSLSDLLGGRHGHIVHKRKASHLQLSALIPKFIIIIMEKTYSCEYVRADQRGIAAEATYTVNDFIGMNTLHENTLKLFSQ